MSIVWKTVAHAGAVLALLSLIQDVAAATASHTDTSIVLNTNFDSQSCNPSGTVPGAAGSASACGLIDGSYGSGSTVTASATAAPGVLRATVNANISSAYANTARVMWNTAGNGGVSASQQDSFIVSAAGLNGRSGRLVAAYYIHGNAVAAVSGIPGPVGNDSGANYQYFGTVNLERASAAFRGSGSADIHGQHVAPDNSPLGYVELSTAFNFGVPISVSSTVAMDWSAHARRIVNSDLSYSDSTASVQGNFGSTIYWGGIVELRDGNGVLIDKNSYTALSSGSGINYANAVPEPAQAWLWLTGLATLGGLARRRGTRQVALIRENRA